MKITFDPAKRDWTLRERGLDFFDAAKLFEGPNYRFIDDRFDYGEERIVTIGRLAGRMLVIVWTPREGARHVISMRKANDREQARYRKYLD
jgi:uncharacterized DUF497 family protein